MANGKGMHRLYPILAFVILPLTQLAGVTIESAYSRFYDAGEIRPIAQYFGGSFTGQGFRTVIASQPDYPQGQYFIAKLDEGGDSSATIARMTYFISDSKKAVSHEWDLAGENLRGWLYLGLTGSDWSSEEVQPLAWKIELLAANGSVLATWKSFLWEMP
jgi:hypothetical protein